MMLVPQRRSVGVGHAAGATTRLLSISSNLMPVSTQMASFSAKGLPALDGDIDEAGLDLDRVGPAPDPLRCKDGRAGPTEDVEHDVAPTGAIPHRIRNQRDRLDRRVELELVQAARPKRVDPGVVPDVGSRATVASQFDVVEVGVHADAEDADQLMLAPVKRALAGIRLHPDGEVEHLVVDHAAGFDKLADVAPVHANVMNGTIA